ncbi:MAG: FxsA family protein [Kangiellaceae bacterium]
MFRFLFILFILVPIIEIGVFIQVGDQLGLGATIAIVIITAVIGVNLLKQQGFVAMRDIQNSLNQGKMPALELAAGAQLLFAGGLLLTPGFVTDSIGFLLMVPAIRMAVASILISRIKLSNLNGSSAQFGSGAFYHHQNTTSSSDPQHSNQSPFHHSESQNQGRIIEGEVSSRPEPEDEQNKG